jgi:hypothetical protein
MIADLKIATYASKRDNEPATATVPWSALVAQLKSPITTACTTTTCAGKECPHKDQLLWSPVDIDGTRANKNVRSVTAVVVDLDHLDVTADNTWLEALKSSGVAAVVHSTHSHAPGSPSLRLVMPVSRPVLPAEWSRVWSAVLSRYQLPGDPACKDPSRAYYAPTTRADVAPVALTLEGESLDVDALLAELPAANENAQQNRGDDVTLNLGDTAVATLA